jgi:hypothetical protein
MKEEAILVKMVQPVFSLLPKFRVSFLLLGKTAVKMLFSVRLFSAICRSPTLILSVLFLLSFEFCAAAAPNQVRTMTHGGVPLDEPIEIRVGKVTFRVPAGYLAPWPTREMRNRVNEWRSLSFGFWMPDKRYLRTDPFFIAGFRPKEPGIGAPPINAHVVQVRQLQPVVLNDPSYVSPEKAFRNLTSIAGLASYSFKEEKFGLVRFWQHDWSHPQPEPFTDYRHLQGADPEVLLHCVPTSGEPMFPGCHGYIYFVAEGFGFSINFARAHLSEWHEIVIAVRDLFNSWKLTQ